MSLQVSSHSPGLRRSVRLFVAIAAALTIAPAAADGKDPDAESDALVVTAVPPVQKDRIWSLSTRHLPHNICRANLDDPSFATYRIDPCGRRNRIDAEQFYQQVGSDRDLVIYVHGNRLNRGDAVERGLTVYRLTRCYQRRAPVDWVIWTWPADSEGLVVYDARKKLARLDAQGMYLAWLLRKKAEVSYRPTTLIGYSFGVRIISGALHAMAGGKLAGRAFPAEPITGMPYDVGFVAPATESTSLSARGVHRLATKNMDQMVLLYNSNDMVLKRYWLLNRVYGTLALGYTGYTGPRMFAPRADNSLLPIQSRECSYGLGFRHEEIVYYRTCRAGRDIAALINDIDVSE